MREPRKQGGWSAVQGDRVSAFLQADSQVGVIGGNGEMGGLFARFFAERGFRVAVADLDTALSNHEVVASSDIVVFSVPLHLAAGIIRSLVPHTRPDQLLLDVTSLKADPIREMMASQASVVGLHPMFGGRISSFAGQTLVACPVRIAAPDWGRLRKLFTDQDIKVKECSPEEHDRMMSIIQVLFHLTTMLVGRTLRRIEVNIAETMDYTSPSYRLEINLLGRMFAQSAELYSAITQMNPYTADIIRELQAGLASYQEWYAQGDLAAFVRDFQESARHLGDFCPKAYQESSAMLDFAVRLGNRAANSNG
jgi:prephenate dehydrogenase